MGTTGNKKMKQQTIIAEDAEDANGIELIEKVKDRIKLSNTQFYDIVKDLRIIRDKQYYKLVKNFKTQEYFLNFDEFCIFYYELSRTTIFNYLQALDYVEKYHPEHVHTCEPVEHRKINLLSTIDNEDFKEERAELDNKVFNEKISFRDLEEEIKSLKVKSIDLDLKKIQPFDENIFYLGETYEEYEDKDILCVEKYKDKIRVHDEYFSTLTTQSMLFKNSGEEFSLREYARVQDFPDNYKFVGNYSEIKKQIGNAVDVKMAQFIINKHINGEQYIDLFCGCGGFSEGAKLNNKKCLYANDNNKFAGYSFKLNFPETLVEISDIKKVDINALKKTLGKVDFILAGCPCQGFSMAGNKFGFECDERNKLYLELIRFLEAFKPAQFIMENVPPILQYKDKIIKDFNEIGYQIKVEKVNGLEIGSKQNRTRIFFIGEIKEGNEKINQGNLGEINESDEYTTNKVIRKNLIGEKSQLEYLSKRNKSYDKKYGMFFKIIENLSVKRVLELYGGIGIQTHYLEKFKKINSHKIIERNQECYKILKSSFPNKEIILADNRDLKYKETYDLTVLDSGMNASNFNETIKLIENIDSKYFIITETGAFRVKFNKNLNHEDHYKNIIEKFNSVGFKVEKILYEYNYGLILIHKGFTENPSINKNTFTNEEWRNYIKKIKR